MRSSSVESASRTIKPQSLLYTLMIPAVILPLNGWMVSVALPIMRDELAVSAETVAWLATAFALPFTVMMPIFGRLSDGLGKRRILLSGIAIFLIGSLVVIVSNSIGVLVFGRVVQGFGIASVLPLSLALISEVFPKEQRGNAMGTYSTIGPLMGMISPLLAGIVVAAFGWRAAFVPAMLFSLTGFAAVYKMIPSTNRKIDLAFLRTFDWIGAGLLALGLTLFIFYLSSRALTGVPPLQDWRLGLAALAVFALFVWHENRRANPFLQLNILRISSLTVGSIGASLRMLQLSGTLSFLVPLYLADVFTLSPTRTGFLLMLNPMMMTAVVRLAGQLSDRIGSRAIVMTGFTTIFGVLLGFGRISAEAPLWIIGLLLLAMGFGSGIMLATLHRASLYDIPEADLGAASGVYSMIRFLGSTFGAAIGGIALQYFSERLDILSAYQNVFYFYAIFAVLGIIIATRLPKTDSTR